MVQENEMISERSNQLMQSYLTWGDVNDIHVHGEKCVCIYDVYVKGCEWIVRVFRFVP